MALSLDHCNLYMKTKNVTNVTLVYQLYRMILAFTPVLGNNAVNPL